MIDPIQAEIEKSILTIKTRIVNKIMHITAPVLHVAYIFSIARYFAIGWHNVYLVQTIIILSFDLVYLFRKNFSTNIKIHTISILFLLVAVYSTYSFGFTGGFCYGITTVTVSAILLGKRPAIIYTIFFLGRFASIGFGYVFGGLKPTVDLNIYSHGLAIWITMVVGISAQLVILIGGFSSYFIEIFLLLKRRAIATNNMRIARKKLIALRREKDVLFKELHHRIKNNLNTISSLLYLKSNMSSSKELQDFVNDTIQRINTTSDLHDQLLKLEEFGQLYSREYFNKLILNIQQSFPKKELINLQVKIEDHKLDIDLMLDIGYILNEILSNSYKYAYTDFSYGEIQVHFFFKSSFYELHIQDFGKGFAPEDTNDSLGLLVIDSLVDKCGGYMKLDINPGVKYVIKIPEASNVLIPSDGLDQLIY